MPDSQHHEQEQQELEYLEYVEGELLSTVGRDWVGTVCDVVTTAVLVVIAVVVVRS